MKYLRKLLLALLICAAPISMVSLSGCHLSRQRVVFNSIATVEIAVDSTYKSYLDLVVAGKVPTTSVTKISNEYDQFQAAVRLAIVQAHGNTNAVANSLLSDTGANLINAILAMKGSKK